MNIRVCCISDTHEQHHKVKIEPCDILIHAGDISGVGGRYPVLDFIDWIEQQNNATYKVWVAGNHDRGFEKKPSWLIDRINHMNNNTYYLEDSGVNILGLDIYGSPWQPEFFDWEFNLPRGEALAEKWKMIPKKLDILITHGPPYRICDSIPEKFRMPGQIDLHVGDKDLLDAIEERDIGYHIFGHIHPDNRKKIVPATISYPQPKENHWYAPVTTHINASLLDNNYKMIVEPYYFNIETNGEISL